jgi:hypothetical protein
VASFWGRVTTATSAAFLAWRRTYENPEAVQGGKFESRRAMYNLLWQYYTNEAFEDLAKWTKYKQSYSLYRQTRSLYNVANRLAEFYAAQVYPGVLSEDGAKLPEGVPLAIPLAEDTPMALRAAIAQFWQWTNWQAGKAVYVRYGAIAGSVLVEVVDDLDRGKITANVVWPGLIADLTLDATGNVKLYSVEYRAYDSEKQTDYTFKKVVDAEMIRTFRDDRPWAPDGGDPAYPNPYGFVPAVWAKHRDLGGDHGAPAIHGSLGKIDELNSLASHIHDQIHKVIGAPIVIASSGNVTNILARSKRGPTDELDVPEADKETVLMLKAPEGTTVASLAGDLDLAQAMPYLEALLTEIERDNPELGMYRELRAMSQVTGPGAARMMGDVAGNVWEAAATYDQQSVKLFQMAVAIAGWRVERGDWGRTLTRQQEKFRGFNLESYQKGELDFDISPRPLIPPTEEERISAEQAKTGVERQKLNLAADKQALSGDAAGIANRLNAAVGAAE